MEAAVVLADEPRELTPEEIAQRRETCHELELTIKDSILHGRQAMWELSKALYQFNEEHGWSALGYETQGEWLAQPEIGISSRQYHRMVRLWKETVITRAIPEEEVAEIEPSKLEIVLPAIEANKTTVVEALEDARSMAVRDLRETYIGAQAALPSTARGEEDASGHTAEDEAPKGRKPKDGTPLYVRGAQAFDSWISIGGDRRKAVRGWSRFLDESPLFQAVHLIEAFIQNEALNGDVPDKTQVREAWKVVLRETRLVLPTE
jgi:hypothetical protein